MSAKLVYCSKCMRQYDKDTLDEELENKNN